jgi:hypothetical protein
VAALIAALDVPPAEPQPAAATESAATTTAIRDQPVRRRRRTALIAGFSGSTE